MKHLTDILWKRWFAKMQEKIILCLQNKIPLKIVIFLSFYLFYIFLEKLVKINVK